MPDPSAPEILLAHTSGLRSLARSLVPDEGAADDLVQETWLAALTRRRSEGDRELGGWLRTVLVNLARKRGRGASARRAREEANARPETTELDASLAARRDVLVKLVGAVTSLDAKDQEVILLRYFEDLTRREMATRLGLPEATVRSRLWRALARLREQLDDEAGGRDGWMPALVALTGLERSSAVGTAAGGALAGGAAPAPPTSLVVLVMASKSKLALVGAGLALLLFLVWMIPLLLEQGPDVTEGVAIRPPARSAAMTELLPVSDRAADEETTVEEEPVPEEEEEVAAAPLEVEESQLQPAQPLGTQAYTVEVLVVDAFDVPLPGARVFAAPRLHPMCDFGVTNKAGALQVSWFAEVGRMSIDVAVAGPSLDGVELRRLEVFAGLTHTLRVALFDEVRFANRKNEETLESLGYVQRGGRPRWRDDEVLIPPALHRAPPPYSMEIAGQTVNYFRWGRGEEPLRRKKQRREVSGAFAPDGVGSLVIGEVRDVYGRPATGAFVTMGFADGVPEAGFRTGEGGVFRLEGLLAGRWSVFAGGGKLGQRIQHFDVADGEETYWRISLDRGNELVGDLFDERGMPAVGWRIEIVGEGAQVSFLDADVTDEEGGFSLSHLPDLGYRVFAWPPMTSNGFPAHSFSASADGRFRKEVVSDVQYQWLTVNLTAYEEDEDELTEVRLWDTEGRGAWLVKEYYQSRHGPWQVPPGAYHLEVGNVSRGFVESEVKGMGVLTEQRPVLLEPGVLTVVAKKTRSGARWELWRRGSEVSSFMGVLGRDSVSVPDGEYELLLRKGEAVEAAHRVFVGAGAHVELDLTE